ncbi:MAG TPA: S41 family peptidase [Bryobacteraceae bacterium]|nr:S41 family peptidase [Bryobacteraceae bacterium]
MHAESKQRAEILKSIKKRVLAHHINVFGVDYDAWGRRVEERTPNLIAADQEGFETGVRQLLAELKTSHTAFYHSAPKEMLPQHTINASLRDLTKTGCTKWMFLDVFEGGPASAAGIKPGDILEAVEGDAAAPPAMPQFGFGQTHEVFVRRPATGAARDVLVSVPQRKATKQRPPIVEPKSPTHMVIAPQIGLLKIVYFPGAFGMGFAKALDAAVDDLKNQGCDRLIIDLRGNIGGSLGFARLASYLCPGKIAIGHSLTPNRMRAGYDPAALPRIPMPSNSVELLTSLGRFAFQDKSLMLLTQGLGPQPFHGRIVVLVNEWTNSAAEMIANFASENKLATVIGQKTRGNVLGATNFDVGGEYWLRLPVFGWFTSQGRSLEGVGVDPDIDVDTSPSGLAAGDDNQMIKAMETLDGSRTRQR